MKFDGFIGGANQSRSPNVDTSTLVNLYVEATGEGLSFPKNARALYGTPGLRKFVDLPTSPVRGVWTNESRMFAVAGSKLYEVFRQAGKCTTNGTAVTWSSGAHFDATNGAAGNTIWINGAKYAVDHYIDGSGLVLTTSAGVQAAPVAFSCGTYDERGDVGNDGLPVYLYPNGAQLWIVSNQTAYVDTGLSVVQCAFTGNFTGTVDVTQNLITGLASVALVSGDKFTPDMAGGTITIAGTNYTVAIYLAPDLLELTTNPASASAQAYSYTPTLKAASGTFIDGYFAAAAAFSKLFNVSAINNGLSWDPLDYGRKTGQPDNILRVFSDHEELWLFGTDTTEVWQDTGNNLFPFERLPSGFIHHGLAARGAVNRLREGVAWLSTDPDRGGIVAYLATGFTPQRISTHEEETLWDSFATVADAVSYTYIENGHEFWVITFPSANQTRVFDATAGVWSARGHWNGATNDMQLQAYHASVWAGHYVGAYASGAIYQASTAFTDDDGTAIHWERTAPYISDDEIPLFFNWLQLDMEVAQSLAAPAVYLSWSDDGGHTWATPVLGTPDRADYAGRLVWRQLGRALHRAFKATGTGAAGRVAIVQALVDITKGR